MERVSVAPEVEPITVDEAKAQVRELPGILTEDGLIQSYISTVRDYAERMTGRAIMTQTVEAYFDYWQTCFELRKGPVSEVLEVAYLSESTPTTYTALNSSNYYTDLINLPASVIPTTDATLPTLAERTNAVRITFKAGVDDTSDVPPSLKQAMRLLFGMYYQERDNMEIGSISNPTQYAADRLLHLNRLYF